MPPKAETIYVKVVKVLFPKKADWKEPEESGGKTAPTADEPTWYILQTDSWIAKGNLTWRPAENERLILTGYPQAYQGRLEFKFTSATPDIPVNQRDILSYACELTRGIGPAIEEKIWNARADDWRLVTESDVPEMGRQDRLRLFQETIDKIDGEIEKTKAIGFIMAHNGTLNMATLAWSEWKLNTIEVITDNPYRLSDLPHYGFSHIDGAIRRSFEIDYTDPRRIRAGIEYAMKQLTERGDTAIEWPALHSKTVEILGTHHSEAISIEVRGMIAEKRLVPFRETKRLSLADDYRYEMEIYNYATR